MANKHINIIKPHYQKRLIIKNQQLSGGTIQMYSLNIFILARL